MDNDELDYLRRTSPDDLLGKGPPEGWIRAGDLGYMPPDEPEPPVVKAAPAAPKPAPRPKVKSLQELLAMSEAEQKRYMLSLTPSTWEMHTCILEGLRIFNTEKLGPIRERLTKCEAENLALRAELRKATQPFIAPADERDDAERWQ